VSARSESNREPSDRQAGVCLSTRSSCWVGLGWVLSSLVIKTTKSLVNDDVYALPNRACLYCTYKGERIYNLPIQVNKATSWIDGNFIYGRGEVWANALRSFTGGRLAVSPGGRGSNAVPAYNSIRLPLDNYPNSETQSVHKPEKLWSKSKCSTAGSESCLYM
jgi:Animal haem peroxidase